MATLGHPFVHELSRLVAAGFPVIAVATREEARARRLLASALPARPLRIWTASDAPATDLAAALAREVRAAADDPSSTLLVLDVHPLIGDPRVARALRDFVASHAVPAPPVVLLAPALVLPIELERDVALVDLPSPSDEELADVLDRVVGEHPVPVLGERVLLLRSARGLGELEAERAFRLAAEATSVGEAVIAVSAEKRRVLAATSTLELFDATTSLEDVGGLGVLKAWLTERVLAFDDEARAFGLDQPRGMLVCGVQGCGKSLVSKAAASTLGLPLIRLDFAAVFAARAPELALKDALRAVEAVAPVVLWVDEIEKGLTGRAEDAELARSFGLFLTWLQERRAPVFVAATANEVERLPPELARRGRFDEVFFVDLPGLRERAEILALHLARRGRDAGAFDLAELARRLDRFSGAELEQLVAAALFRAYGAGRDLEAGDLVAAAGEIVPLAILYEERVTALRRWAEARARRAAADRRALDLFDP